MTADFEDYGILPDKGRRYEQIIYLMALIYGVIDNKASAHLAGFGLTIAKFNILMAVKNFGGRGGLRQTDISRRLIVSDGNITKILDRLKKQGFIIRTTVKRDRRVNIIKITSKGAKIVASAWAGYDAILKDFAAPLSVREQEQISETLKKWFASAVK